MKKFLMGFAAAFALTFSIPAAFAGGPGDHKLTKEEEAEIDKIVADHAASDECKNEKKDKGGSSSGSSSDKGSKGGSSSDSSSDKGSKGGK